MKLPFTGGCLCGEVRYQGDAEPLRMLNCHCRDCQQLSGAAYAPILAVRLKNLKFIKGAPQHYITTRVRGGQNKRGFCASCGCQLTVGEDAERDFIGVMAASLDDPAWFKPEMDIFVSDAQPWDLMDANLAKHPQYPPRKPPPVDQPAPNA